MKRIGLILILCCSYVTAQENCVKNAEILKAASNEQLESFRNWAKHINPESPNYDEWMQYADKTTIYFADVDNDGNSEYLVEYSSGSGAFTNLVLYRSTKDGFKSDGYVPPAPENAGDMWYSWEYLNPITEDTELLTRVCGKVYFSFTGGELDLFPGRDSYIWENGKTAAACNADWIEYSRGIFKKLYDRKDYVNASDFLRSVADQCEGKIDASQRAWIYNDLAITQFHLGDSARCQDYAAKAKADPNALDANKVLKQAIETNESLCKNADKEFKLPNFDWLLDASLQNTNQVVISKKFDELLTAVVPNVDVVRGSVKLDLHGPPNEKDVSQNRYVMLSACMAHNCEEKGMLWVDTTAKIGIFALNNTPIKTTDANCYSLGSRNITAKKIPDEFWKAFLNWEAAPVSDDNCGTFIDASGKTEEISLPARN
jgi:hypothetical protein